MRRLLILALLLSCAAPRAGAQSFPTQEAHPSRGSAVLRRVAYAAGGMLLGAGLGYFASQVVHSDWDRSTDSGFARLRLNYALAGSAAGGVVGALVARPSSRPSLRGYEVPDRNSVIGAAEIAAAGVPTAYDVVQRLHPNWLVERRSKNLAEQGRIVDKDPGGHVVAAPGAPTIQVYLDLANLGGVDALRQVPVGSLRSIEYLDPARATYRFGAGHTHGVILLTTIGASGR
jgi:hypothetical protein